MIKAIIFDFDGVIHNTLELAYSIHKGIMNDISIEEYKDFFNGNIYKHGKITSSFLEEFFKLQNRKFKKLKIKKHIKKELVKMKKSYSLFIVSSNMEVALNNYLENNNIAHIFEEVLGMESYKSKVEKFKLLMERHSLNQGDCLFITDTLGDILEANEIGLKTIAVDFGFHERVRLEQGKPFKIVSDFKELLPEIKNLMESK